MKQQTKMTTPIEIATLPEAVCSWTPVTREHKWEDTIVLTCCLWVCGLYNWSSMAALMFNSYLSLSLTKNLSQKNTLTEIRGLIHIWTWHLSQWKNQATCSEIDCIIRVVILYVHMTWLQLCSLTDNNYEGHCIYLTISSGFGFSINSLPGLQMLRLQFPSAATILAMISRSLKHLEGSMLEMSELEYYGN